MQQLPMFLPLVWLQCIAKAARLQSALPGWKVLVCPGLTFTSSEDLPRGRASKSGIVQQWRLCLDYGPMCKKCAYSYKQIRQVLQKLQMTDSATCSSADQSGLSHLARASFCSCSSASISFCWVTLYSFTSIAGRPVTGSCKKPTICCGERLSTKGKTGLAR